jgi:hypothetical protein
MLNDEVLISYRKKSLRIAVRSHVDFATLAIFFKKASDLLFSGAMGGAICRPGRCERPNVKTKKWIRSVRHSGRPSGSVQYQPVMAFARAAAVALARQAVDLRRSGCWRRSGWSERVTMIPSRTL